MLSIIVPVRNESKTIKEVFDYFNNNLKNTNYEVLIINDFSNDLIFNEIDEKFWTTFLSKNGGKNKIFSNYPKDPSLN